MRPPKGSEVGATDESKVGELEEEITHLKEQLVQALSAQVHIHFWDLYCMYLS